MFSSYAYAISFLIVASIGAYNNNDMLVSFSLVCATIWFAAASVIREIRAKK